MLRSGCFLRFWRHGSRFDKRAEVLTSEMRISERSTHVGVPHRFLHVYGILTLSKSCRNAAMAKVMLPELLEDDTQRLADAVAYLVLGDTLH